MRGPSVASAVAFSAAAGDHARMAIRDESATTQMHVAHAWVDNGWTSDARIDFSDAGVLSGIESANPPAATIAATTIAATTIAAEAGARDSGWMLPGIPNLHSHAFQRAMAGLAERPTNPQDSFWTWRETMYRFAAQITPDSLFAIASQLYVEMLEAGYTSVCEFHYLHHRPDATPYADPAAMSQAIVAAARETGIGLTLLPVLYMSGGFDGRPLSERQQRFGHTVDAFLALLQSLRAQQDAQLNVGIAFHSLRAVPEAAMREVLDALGAARLPIHLHVAEQIGEVQDSLALRNARPVEWLLANMPVDARWTLVHATHLTPEETRGIAHSGATVAICPTTEANLGDGLFPLRDYLEAGGIWGIGSDSQISVSPVEELRWLEYGQRLLTRQRNLAVAGHDRSTGEALLLQALHGGARSSMRPIGALQAGQRADFLLLDAQAPQLASATGDDAIDRFVFSGNRNLVRETWVGGQRVVADGRHIHGDRILARYRSAIADLAQ
jgi:formimidoylglutamate deiminase